MYFSAKQYRVVKITRPDPQDLERKIISKTHAALQHWQQRRTGITPEENRRRLL